MAHAKRAVIFDVDGTAVDSPAKMLPTPRLAMAIADQKAKYYFSAATARPWSFAQPVIHALELEDPCIVAGGTQICDPKTGATLWQADVPTADVEKIRQILAAHNTARLLYNDFTDQDYYEGGHEPAKLRIQEPVYFMFYAFVPEAEVPDLVKQLTKIESITYALGTAHRKGYQDIHITPREATKEHAVQQLCRILGADPKHAIGAGDGPNDIHLFNAVGHKVAMGNAKPELKAAADEVIGTVQDDGLAAFIERLP